MLMEAVRSKGADLALSTAENLACSRLWSSPQAAWVRLLYVRAATRVAVIHFGDISASRWSGMWAAHTWFEACFAPGLSHVCWASQSIKQQHACKKERSKYFCSHCNVSLAECWTYFAQQNFPWEHLPMRLQFWGQRPLKQKAPRRLHLMLRIWAWENSAERKRVLIIILQNRVNKGCDSRLAGIPHSLTPG